MRNFVLSEPVRVRIYSIAVAVLALLVGLGVIDSAVSGLIAAVCSAVLAVGVETARSRVSPRQ